MLFRIGCVLNDFEARYVDELTLKAGDSVKLLEIIDDNWVKCQNIAENEQIGLVPISYLQIFLENNENISLKNRNSLQLQPNNTLPSKYVPWDNVFNSISSQQPNSSIKDIIPNHPTVPSFEPFNVLEFDNFQKTKIKKDPPFRPPPPKVTIMNLASTKKPQQIEIFSPSNLSSLNNINKEGLNEKEKVIQDLLSTEIVYLFDLNAWESVRFYQLSFYLIFFLVYKFIGSIR